MSNTRNIKQSILNLLASRKDVQVPAFLGNLTGTVKADANGNVYVTLFNGEVVTVRNQRVPNIPRLPVLIGYEQGDKNILQVLRSRAAYASPSFPDVGEHAEKTHEWPGVDTLWVRGEQFVPGLAVPYSNALTVQIFGFVYYLDNAWHLLNTQDVDLSGNVPASGARYVLAEVDDAGTISLRNGSDVAARGVLTYADVPAPNVDKMPLFAVALYAGQTQIVKTRTESDIVDLRFSRYGAGGMALSVEWDDIVNVPTNFVRKFSFASDPTVNDDSGDGYEVMDEWLNTTSGDVFKLKDATVGAAVWELEGGSGGGGHVIEDEGTPLTQRAALNFVGAGVTVTDDAGNDASVVSVPGYAADTNAAANKATTVDADRWGIWDSVTGLIAHVTWANIKTTLKTYFDTVYAAISHVHSGADITSGTVGTARLGSGTANSTTFLRGDQTWATPYKIQTSTNFIFRCDAPGGVSLWTGTISGAPSGTSVTVSAPTSGTEGVLVPFNTSTIGKLRLYNLTRGDYALISNYNTTTNVVTLTANAPAGWANGDSLTIVSQTVSGVYNWIDIEITSEITNKSVLFFTSQYVPAAAGQRVAFHPTETYSEPKIRSYFGQVAGVPVSISNLPMIINGNLFTMAWNGNHTIILIRLDGYID